MANIKDLHESDQKLLESILNKPKDSLTQEDLAILNARRDYLSYPQRQAYGDLIVQDGEQSTGEQAAPVDPQKPTDWVDPQANQAQQEATEAENAETTTDETTEAETTTTKPAQEQTQTQEQAAATETTDNPYAPDDTQQLA